MYPWRFSCGFHGISVNICVVLGKGRKHIHLRRFVMALAIEKNPGDTRKFMTVAVRNALKYAATKSQQSGGRNLLASLEADDECAKNYFVYALARSLAEEIGYLDMQVSAGYVLCTEQEGHPEKPFPITLVLQATYATAALKSIIGQVCEDIHAVLSSVAHLSPGAARSLIEIEVVEDEDVEMGRGVGAAIRSLWAPPLKVWSRK
jgi:hypothetical protein